MADFPLPVPPQGLDRVTKDYLDSLVSALDLRTRATVLITGGNAPSGSIVGWPAEVIPDGWLECNGALYDSAIYPALYAVLGTTWNTGGEGAGFFRVPNYVNKFMYGSGGTVTVGMSGGSATSNALLAHTHTITDPGHGHTVTLDPHDHTITDPGHVHSGGVGAGAALFENTIPTGGASANTGSATTGITVNSKVVTGSVSSAFTGISVNSAGSGSSFSIMPPWAASKIIIKA